MLFMPNKQDSNNAKIKTNTKKQDLLQFLLDFAPIALFFIAFKVRPPIDFFNDKEPIIFASLVLGVATIFCLALSLFLKVKISKINMYSSFAVVLFSVLTIVFNNPDFIKVKITIINGTIAIFIYLFCMITKKSFVKQMFEGKVTMEEFLWLKLDKRFFYMFLVMAILNEICWRSFSTSTWVNYKVFVAMPIMMVFFAMQIPYLKKHGKWCI